LRNTEALAARFHGFHRAGNLVVGRFSVKK
jgi:hypothetical protein